jgi:ribonuclease inhibitor
MKVEIDGASIRTESDLHRLLSAELDFGPYYGENLSALWDRLSTDVERPVELVWKDSEESRKSLGDATFGKIRKLLLDVQQQDEAFGLVRRFTVVFE